MKFGYSLRHVLPPGVDADHSHAKSRTKPGRLAPYPAHSDDEGGGFRQEQGVVPVLIQRTPVRIQLLPVVVGQPFGECQEHGHYVDRNVVVVDFPEVSDRDRVADQFRVVVAGRRCGGRRLKPRKFAGFRQHFGGDRAERSVGIDDFPLRFIHGFRRDERNVRYGVR